MKFPFNQPDKTRDCGYRCLYYVLQLKSSYEEWLNNFKLFNPAKSGIHFADICDILDYYKIDYRFTQVSDKGVFLIYSGIWLHHEGKKHGHYFVYDNGTVLCSTRSSAYKMPLEEVVKRLEGKTVEHAFRCLKIL